MIADPRRAEVLRHPERARCHRATIGAVPPHLRRLTG